MMRKTDFYVEFYSEVDYIGDQFKLEAERRLTELTEGRSDIVGASVALENIVEAESPYRYQARIILYKRPKDLVVIKKDSEPMAALDSALDALEREVRETREKLDTTHYKQAQDTEEIVDELSADEIYAAYASEADPSELLEEGRTKLATKLMVEEGFDEEAAYYTADQILSVALKKTENP